MCRLFHRQHVASAGHDGQACTGHRFSHLLRVFWRRQHIGLPAITARFCVMSCAAPARRTIAK
jgi:hypothetical protein